MTFSKISFFVVISAITALAGCSTSRFEDNNDNAVEVIYPLQQLSEPETMSVLSVAQESEVAEAPRYEKRDPRGDEKIAGLEVPSDAVNLFPASIAGVWNLSVNGKVCRIATPQTKFGQGYRAGPLHCPGIISRINSWAIKGKRLYFYDNSGRVIAALYSSNIDHFEGRTLNDLPVVLRR
ncbi:AprI/Inh family metalloprotease inhibitor [Bartonella raoultii]|uniref:Protease inhibitor Inh/omp19 family protein n=1 Tax=Bartonella raoultii TaxID=1457020 RepID=A0ABS7I8M5_9HYPH|nr:AprI/Inh family metalloprotease inhibitor [Bartonella raoultii]MBX4335997.1 protease inhibitor Inh/omp19 family protein [Bartonella raoultii]